jgi:hypothetical protein
MLILPLHRLAAQRVPSFPVENALRHGAPSVRLTVCDEGACELLDVTDTGP